NLQVVGASEIATRFSKTAQHETVPGGEDFLIASGFDALLTYFEEHFAAAFERGLHLFQAEMGVVGHFLGILFHMQDILPFKVALWCYIVVLHEQWRIF